MRSSHAVLLAAAAMASVVCGCGAKRSPSDELGAKETGRPIDLSAYAAPLDLREFQVDTADGGYRGVFLKFSRLPTAVSATTESNPSRIILDVQGPTGGESPWETFPGGDTLVTHVGVSRYVGGMRVVLELSADEIPDYGVYPMADWVLVRIKPLNRQVTPWAHRS